MGTKTKAAKPKAKTKSKAKPAPEANHDSGWIPTVGQEPEGAVKQDAPTPRAKPAKFSIRDAAAMLRILADPTRLTVVALLNESPATSVGEIVKNCAVSQPATSHHLALLRHSGLVYSNRSGKQNHYSLTEWGQVAAKLLAEVMGQNS